MIANRVPGLPAARTRTKNAVPIVPQETLMTLSVAQAHALLTAPGAPFEMAAMEIAGVPLRVWKNAPPSLRAVLENSRSFGEAPFIVYEDERLSFADHYRRVCALARHLVEDFGIVKGDRVAIALRNYPEWSIAFWAATAIGAVAVPLNAWMAAAELDYCLTDSGACILVLDSERLDRLRDALPRLSALRATILVRAADPPPSGLHAFAALTGDAPAHTPQALPPAVIAPEDDATIFYTSGTTGKPKGALGTHRNICTNLPSLMLSQARAKLLRGEALPGPNDPPPHRAYLLSVPFFHVTGCHSILLSMIGLGGKLVLMHKWDPLRAMELIERERVTTFGGVPSMAWQVVEHPDFARFDLSSIESIGYGGAPAASELVQRLHQGFPVAAASNGYGLTETSSVVTQNVAEDYLRKPDSAGPAVPICDLRVVDGEGSDVAPGEIGELWVRGPNVVKGYWNRPDATQESFGGGWFKTGDLVRMDDEGFVYILDRAKDMLIRGGENIYCVEVEDALYSHPAIMDAAVIGIPHRILGEEVGAVVQVKPGASVSAEELKRHVAARLAAFKVPVRIELRTEPLPRNANGKILNLGLMALVA